jgi:PAS domain S-box-containing protein
MGIFVYFENKNSRLNRAFLVNCLCFAAWTFVNFMVFQAGDLNTAYFWSRAGGSLMLFTAASLLVFALVFIGWQKILRNKLVTAVIYAPAIILSVISIVTNTGGVVIRRVSWGYAQDPQLDSWVFLVMNYWGIGTALAALLLCLMYFIKASDKKERNRAKYVLLGFSMPVVIGTLGAMILPLTRVYSSEFLPLFYPVSFAAMMGFIGYAVWKYELFVLNPSTAAENIISTMPDALALFDTHGQVLNVNRSLTGLLGWGGAELVGSPANILFARKSEFWEILQRLMDGEKLQGYETKFRTKSGKEIGMSLGGARIKDKAGEVLGAILVAHDETDRIVREELLMQKTKESEEASQKKTDFVSDVSHELRTPLASIKGFTATILSDEEMDPRTRQDFLMTIDNEADRLTRLLNDLLDLSRIESGRIKLKEEKVRLTDLIKKSVESIRNQAEEKHLKLNMQLPEEFPLVFADSDKMSQIIINLLSNAIKYTLEGEVLISARKENGYVRVEVSDTGIGIAKEHLPKVFEKFQRIETSGIEAKGTGLGLSIVKAMVELQGGEVFVESELGKGTKFGFRLPAMEEGEAKHG